MTFKVRALGLGVGEMETVMGIPSSKYSGIAVTALVVASAMVLSTPASAQDCFDHVSTRDYTPWNCTAMPLSLIHI